MHTEPTTRLIGRDGEDLTGTESRALRAALGLERRHVVALCDALNLWGGDVDDPHKRVVQWERSKGRGYPAALVGVLLALEQAVDAWADLMTEESEIRRPLGARRVVALLRLPAHGLRVDPDAFDVLDVSGGEFWHALADAAVTRALLYMRIDGARGVRVVLDVDPDSEAG